MAERAFEELLRTSLASAVEDAAAPPLAQATRRRVRMRQGALLGVAGIVAIAGTFGAVRAGAAVFAGDDIPPAGHSRELVDERGSGGRYPCSFGSGPGGPRADCVAAGERDEVAWKLGASVDPDHGFCLTLETIGGPGAAGAGSSCNEHEPGEIGIESTGVEGLPMLAYGYVPGEAERLVLEHGAEESFDLQVYPAPDGFPLDVGFYLVWLPDDAVRLVAYDDAGEEVARRAFDGGPDGTDPERTENIEIGSGSLGVRWELEAYGIREDGREIVCTVVEVPGERTRALAPCDASFGRESATGITAFAWDEPPRNVLVGGVTTSKAGSVVFADSDGNTSRAAAMVYPPRGIDPALGFFVVFVSLGGDQEASGTMIVRDHDGDVIEKRDYCIPGGEGLSC